MQPKDSPPISPRGRRHVRCLGCEIPKGQLCTDCSWEGGTVRLIAQIPSDAPRKYPRTAALAAAGLGGGMLAALLVYLLYRLGLLLG